MHRKQIQRQTTLEKIAESRLFSLCEKALCYFYFTKSRAIHFHTLRAREREREI